MRRRRPHPSEYHEYYGTYVDKVEDGDILETLERLRDDTRAFLGSVPGERETFRYREGAWSVREAVGHVVDTERLFGFRALWFARRDPAAQPGMDQDLWARSSSAGERPLADLADELRLVRDGHLLFFRSLEDGAWNREGVASGRTFTVRALAWIMAGHELHHLGILKERYGLASPLIPRASGRDAPAPPRSPRRAPTDPGP